MKRLVAIILVVVSSILCSAEVYRVSGIVLDYGTAQPIENVSISCKVKGRMFTAMTDSLGRYSLSIPDNARFVLKASHVSYKPQTKLIIFSNRTASTDFDLEAKDHTLSEVLVKANAGRVAQRNDTTVYFANAYKVNTDATAYDLITQKLPGIGIRDGKLEAHGETVKEILIDGKEYFKSDITLSLKNLPADIINEIQLFDQVSDYSRLTGFDEGTRRKVINITTKRGMDNSVFGKAYAGYGLDNYYKAYGMLNWFQVDRQLSVFAQANNTSEQNFSMIDLLSTTGTSMNTAPQQSPYSKGSSDNTFHPATTNDISEMMVGGYSAGETRTTAAGTNFSDIWGHSNNIAFSGHYMFNNAINETDYDIRDDYYNEGSNSNLQTQYVRTDNTNHRFNTKIDWDISQSSHLMFRPSFLYQQQKEYSQMYISEEGHTTLDLTPMLEQTQNTDQEALSTSNELMFIHRFSSYGSSLSANVKYSFENTDEDLVLSLDNLLDNRQSSQKTWSQNRTQSVAAVGSYIHPFGRNIRLKVDAGWSSTYRFIKRNTLRSDSLNITMNIDSILSGRTTSDYGGVLCGISFLYDRRKTQLVAGIEYHQFRMHSVNDITRKSVECPAILPFLHVRHQWGESNNQLHFQYKADQVFPTTQQLQDAINNVNPTIAIRGNIYLKPSYSHSATIRLLVPGKNSGGIFVFFLNAELKQNYIANKRSIAGGALGAAEQRSQLLSYVNTDGYWSASTLLAYGFPLNPIKSNFNISSLLRYSHIPGYWESAKSYNNQFNWNSSLTVGSNISREIDFVVDFNFQYLNDKNATHPLLDVNYWTFSFGGQLNWQFLPHFKLVAECGRTAYYGLGTNDMNAVIWNMALAYKFLKNKAAEIRVSCDDILDQNNCFTQQTNELFRRKTVANVLGRHAMLTFTYNFNTYKTR